jgi:hypothetical protein
MVSIRVNFKLLKTRSQNYVNRLVVSLYLSVCLSVRPSVRMEQLGYLGKNFYEISFLNIFLKFVENNQVYLESDPKGYFT